MNRKFIINARYLPIWIFAVTGLLVAFLVWNHACFVQCHKITKITDLSARSEDGAIVLSWAPLTDCRSKQIELRICGDGESHCVEIPAFNQSYTFTDGKHGKLYEFFVDVKGEKTPQKANAMFIHFVELPDIPLVSVDTVTGEDPTCEIKSAPAGSWGYTTVENEYVRMQIMIYDHNDMIFQASGQIRIRGNTSAMENKKPYKIKLDRNADLLFRNDVIYQDTEWVLLSAMHRMQLETGTMVSYLCGMDWQPAYMPVNVMLNGNYIGCYYLVESVKVSAGRLSLSSNGFLIENDAYWWDANGVYFRTPYQLSALGYTIKYPTINDPNEPIAATIRDHVTIAESVLMNGLNNYMDYIDVNSYAEWLLAHDILGTYDSGGSNMFIYVEDMGKGGQLKVGPLWDFGSSFFRRGEWARIHVENIMHYDIFLQKKEFREAYLQKWSMLSDSICEDVQKFLCVYTQKYGEALQDSWDLNSECWQVESTNVQETVNYINRWFAERKVWLDMAMQEV